MGTWRRKRELGMTVLMITAGILATPFPSPLEGRPSPRCGDHYAVVESGADVAAFVNSFDSQFGTSDEAFVVRAGGQTTPLDLAKVSGAYGCQFKGDYPPDNACPRGTTLTRGTDARYICHSNEPIAEGSRICLDGFVKIQDYEYDDPPAARIGRYGFICNATGDGGQDGFNEGVCLDTAAGPLLNFVRYETGNPYPMLGCVYLR